MVTASGEHDVISLSASQAECRFDSRYPLQLILTRCCLLRIDKAGAGFINAPLTDNHVFDR